MLWDNSQSFSPFRGLNLPLNLLITTKNQKKMLKNVKKMFFFTLPFKFNWRAIVKQKSIIFTLRGVKLTPKSAHNNEKSEKNVKKMFFLLYLLNSIEGILWSKNQLFPPFRGFNLPLNLLITTKNRKKMSKKIYNIKKKVIF